jgi:tryptophan-rich sensory protein
LFFGMHQVTWALVTIAAMFVLAFATTMLFGRIRSSAAWLMVPYLVWLVYAGLLTYRISELNPGAETLVPPSSTSQIINL